MMPRGVLPATVAGALLLAAPLVLALPPVLIWNASASVPVGLYRASGAGTLRIGDLVAVAPPADLATFLAERGYLPRGVPLLKHVAALADSVACRDGSIVAIDGRQVATARERDRSDRPLPVWSGCRSIAVDEVFLLNPDAADSFDGRYFGPLPRDTITARLTPIWIAASAADPRPPDAPAASEP